MYTIINVLLMLFCVLWIFNLMFTVYASLKPQIIQKQGGWYVRKWSLVGWVYLDNGKAFVENFWWFVPEYVEVWASFQSKEQAEKHLIKVQNLGKL